MRRIIAIAVSMLSLGCVPISGTYLRPDAPGARFFGVSCYGSAGAPAVAYFPYHGAFVSLAVDTEVRMGLHLPSGTTGQLHGDIAQIEAESSGGHISMTLHLIPRRRGSLGSVQPNEFSRAPDLCALKGGLGPFTGQTVDGGYAWCMLVAASQSDQNRLEFMPRGITSGVVELPAISVNGVRYEALRIPFSRQRYSEISPINC